MRKKHFRVQQEDVKEIVKQTVRNYGCFSGSASEKAGIEEKDWSECNLYLSGTWTREFQSYI